MEIKENMKTEMENEGNIKGNMKNGKLKNVGQIEKI